MGKEMPYFSVILPIYNVEKYLERCIKSVLENSYDDYEIILVDDGSTDHSGTICDEYEVKSDCIKVLHKKNGGLSSARNAGLEVAEGQYIFFVDSDDWITPDALQAIYEATVNSHPDILKFNYRAMPSGKDSVSTIKAGEYERDQIINKIMSEVLKNTACVNFSAWSHVYKRTFLSSNELRFVSEREIGSEDYLFNFCCYIKAKKIKSIQNILYLYDLRMGSLTQRYRKDLPHQYEKLHQLFIEAAIQEGLAEKLKKYIAIFYIRNSLFVVMRNEVIAQKNGAISDSKRKIKEILAQEDLKRAVNVYLKSNKSIKTTLILLMMKFRIIDPIVRMLEKSI